jgi:H+/Cl- antiporter ClcA
MKNMGRFLVISGIILIAAGLLIYAAPSLFSWFGKLPGDIRIEKENSKIFIPLTSMLLLSIVLTIIVNLLKFLKR